MAKLSAGDVAPSFSLTDHNEVTVTSESLLGTRYVLYFYPQDDTPGCTREACQFNDHLADFAEIRTAVYGVSPDDAASHRRFRDGQGLGFSLLSDPSRATMAAYGAYGEKLNYGKVIVGVIRSTFVIGPTGHLEHAWYGIKTDGHAARVLATLGSI